MKKSPPKPESQDAGGSGEIRQTALNLLARREHSRHELEYKLASRGYSADKVALLADELAAEGWLSNARFAEQYVHSRIAKGYGPVRIRAELRERGVPDEDVGEWLAGDNDWIARASAARTKRFGSGRPKDYSERARQMRFLQQRGYTTDQIRAALDDAE